MMKTLVDTMTSCVKAIKPVRAPFCERSAAQYNCITAKCTSDWTAD